jgi:CRP-like cAMP-binding protein
MMAENYLLKILPLPEVHRLQSKFEVVSLEPGQLLYESNRRAEYAYFPLTAIAVLLYHLETGASAAVAMTGKDGIIGLSYLLGAGSVPNDAFVQCPGKALRIKNLDLIREFRREGVFHTLIFRFTMALVEQIARTAVCNRVHPIEKQVCRWLLLTHDRIETDTLCLTHEMIATILGASRETVTQILSKFKKMKLLEYRRGEITLLNRPELEQIACECYRRTNDEYNRLMVRGITRTFN